MKRQLLLAALFVAVTGVLISQTGDRPRIPEQLRNLSITKTIGEERVSLRPPYEKVSPIVKAGLPVSESQIGGTRYDQQTNNSMNHRIYRFDDGTVGAVWTRGMTEAGGFQDRGTGYNYQDGTSWGSMPSARVESIKTGWPGYAPLGANGEIVVSHSATTTGLVISRRTNKGTGNWTETYLQGPTGNEKIVWPKVVTSGPNNNTIHILALTAPEANNGNLYNGQDGALLYYRSSDGGDTWDIQHKDFPGLDTSNYIYLGGDVYSWAWPRGDTLAFVMATKWTDVVLMKSVDGGLNWTKTIAAYHPYPHFDFNQTIITDTVYVADGASAIVLDNDGDAHIFFGLMRVNHEEVGDTYQFFPYTDGLAHWKEGDEALQTFDYDSLYDKGHLIGFVQDLNGNDSLDYIWGLEGLGEYVLSLTGMPTATVDENDNIFVLFSSLMEGYDNDLQNYRHLIGRASFDGGNTWVDTLIDLTNSIVHNFDECVFACIAPTSDNFIHYIYMADEEPGMAIDGDEDPYTNNKIIYGMAAKSDFGLSVKELSTPLAYVSQNYPNPFSDQTTIDIGLERSTNLDITVFNLIGQPVWQKTTGKLPGGMHNVTINGHAFTPGIYFLSINSGEFSVSRKMIVE